MISFSLIHNIIFLLLLISGFIMLQEHGMP